MGIFEKLNKKYNMEPSRNEPICVYAPPEYFGIKNEPVDDEIDYEKNIKDFADDCDDNEIVFRYKQTATYGKRGNLCGHSMTLYGNGDLVKEEYIFGQETGINTTKTNVGKFIVGVVGIAFEKYEETIKNCKDDISVMDGTIFEIQFAKKVVNLDNASFKGKIKEVTERVISIIKGADK